MDSHERLILPSQQHPHYICFEFCSGREPSANAIHPISPCSGPDPHSPGPEKKSVEHRNM